MDKGTHRDNYREVISMEEYLLKRQQMKKTDRRGFISGNEEESPAWLLAELYI